jgi:hypothetical protein
LAGKCERGRRCRFTHPKTPREGREGSPTLV